MPLDDIYIEHIVEKLVAVCITSCIESRYITLTMFEDKHIIVCEHNME